MITKTIAMEVTNIVIVVELFARWGILSRLLLTIINNSLAKNAKPAPKMKCQSMSIFSTPIGVRLEPLMKDREPVSRMEMTVTRENRIV